WGRPSRRCRRSAPPGRPAPATRPSGRRPGCRRSSPRPSAGRGSPSAPRRRRGPGSARPISLSGWGCRSASSRRWRRANGAYTWSSCAASAPQSASRRPSSSRGRRRPSARPPRGDAGPRGGRP
ncbi:MAG: hypothetical protein AVDCRST_MAG19-4589, partial [uncultured Thermomicrobiales bacterium]